MKNLQESGGSAQRQTLADGVYSAIRKSILADQMFTAGRFIREQELADAMNVSRTPVREALSRLASEGFLERLPHRGYRVPDGPISGLLDLYPVVSALDLLAGKLAFPNLQNAEIRELRQINREMVKAMESDDAPRAAELNAHFHRFIAQRSGNSRLLELLTDLSAQLTLLELWFYGDQTHTQASIREHDQILTALEKGELGRALDILEHNMELTHKAFLDEIPHREDKPTIFPRSQK